LFSCFEFVFGSLDVKKKKKEKKKYNERECVCFFMLFNYKKRQKELSV